MDPVPAFDFDQSVARVFDDMANRSIPHYQSVQSMIRELSLDWYKKGTKIFDLGCSTGNTILMLRKAFQEKDIAVELVGVDNSVPMLEAAGHKLKAQGFSDVSLVQEDLEKVDLQGASVVIMNYTLQFVPPLSREKIIRGIYEALSPPGILLVSEKTRQSDTNISRFFQQAYYGFKRSMGYSQMEISQKREALENVLIPYTRSEIERLFHRSGFQEVEPFFTWFNFSSYLCLKKEG